jgi:hypothetical protein
LRSGREKRGEVRLKITLTCEPHMSVVEKREERITDRIWRSILVLHITKESKTDIRVSNTYQMSHLK